jgi:hypothetical protein
LLKTMTSGLPHKRAWQRCAVKDIMLVNKKKSG